MLHQKKKQLYFSLVLIYTVNNQLPQKYFSMKIQIAFSGSNKTQPATLELSRFSRYGNPIAWDCRILFMDIFEVNNI